MRNNLSLAVSVSPRQFINNLDFIDKSSEIGSHQKRDLTIDANSKIYRQSKKKKKKFSQFDIAAKRI